MPTYVIVNRVPDDFTPGPEAFAAWTAWFERLGEHLADRGNPAFRSRALGNSGALGGYTLITADDLDGAIALAKDHPLVMSGGGVEIGELTMINSGRHLAARTDAEAGNEAGDEVVDEVVEVSVRVAMPPEDVFPYFTVPQRHVQWMGSEAELEPTPGGVYRLRMPDGFAVAGRFLTVRSPYQVELSWGWSDPDVGKLTKHQAAAGVLPAGSTRVVVTLEQEADCTRVVLRHHDLPTPELRAGHRVAWQAYLDRLVVRTMGGDPGPDPHG